MFSSQPVIIDMESNFLWKEKQHIIKFSLKIWILLNIKRFFNKKELRVPGEGSNKELMETLYVSIPLFRAVKQQLTRIFILA